MTGRLNRVALTVMLCFGVVALSLTYWSVFAADGMLARVDNFRRNEAERTIRRGTIYDISGVVLARSVEAGFSPSGLPVWRRNYPLLNTVGAVGYYSRIYGVGGAEEAFDTTLRGDAQRTAEGRFLDRLLHRTPLGTDLRLTVDSSLQGTIHSALGARSGAAIVVEVPSGAVRAMVSTPIYDVNLIDLTWDRLRIDPAQPLRNRALQGVYQPGGVLQTVIYAAMLTDNKLPPEPINGAASPVPLADLNIACAELPGITVETAARAYAFGCPLIFTDAVLNDPARIQEIMDAFGLFRSPPLRGFRTVPGIGAGETITALDDLQGAEQLIAASVGQGDLAVTPLQIAQVAATIANRGNALTMKLDDATRPSNAPDWQPVPETSVETPILPQAVTEAIRAGMREAVTVGAAQAAGRVSGLPDGATLYGHASLAYSAREVQNAWFVGFVDLPDGRSIAAVVIVENTSNVSDAATIGGRALVEASRRAMGE